MNQDNSDDTIEDVTSEAIEAAKPGDTLDEIVRNAMSLWVQKHTEFIAINSETIIDHSKSHKGQITKSLIEELGEELFTGLYGEYDDDNPNAFENASVRNYDDGAISRKNIVQCDFVVVDMDAIEDLCDITYKP